MPDGLPRLAYVRWKIAAAALLPGRVRVTQHMESPDQRCACMPDSWCSWAIIPDGHDNTLAAETLLPIVWPSRAVRAANARLAELAAPLLVITAQSDVRLGSDAARLRALFGDNRRPWTEFLTVPGEHISCLPMVNEARYAADRDSYTRPEDTYVPEVWPDHNLPALRAFLGAILRLGPATLPVEVG